MFRGSSNHTVDEKGRIIIPSRFRDILKTGGGDGIVLSRLDASLYAYTFDGWKIIENNIMRRPKKTASMRRFRRVFIGGSSECHCDKQGRILIPPTLREYAGLVRDVSLVGSLDHFEIWDRERWAKENELCDADVEKGEASLEIDELGL